MRNGYLNSISIAHTRFAINRFFYERRIDRMNIESEETVIAGKICWFLCLSRCLVPKIALDRASERREWRESNGGEKEKKRKTISKKERKSETLPKIRLFQSALRQGRRNATSLAQQQIEVRPDFTSHMHIPADLSRVMIYRVEIWIDREQDGRRKEEEELARGRRTRAKRATTGIERESRTRLPARRKIPAKREEAVLSKPSSIFFNSLRQFWKI